MFSFDNSVESLLTADTFLICLLYCNTVLGIVSIGVSLVTTFKFRESLIEIYTLLPS